MPQLMEVGMEQKKTKAKVLVAVVEWKHLRGRERRRCCMLSSPPGLGVLEEPYSAKPAE
jgi:hypothetical protein